MRALRRVPDPSLSAQPCRVRGAKSAPYASDRASRGSRVVPGIVRDDRAVLARHRFEERSTCPRSVVADDHDRHAFAHRAGSASSAARRCAAAKPSDRADARATSSAGGSRCRRRPFGGTTRASTSASASASVGFVRAARDWPFRRESAAGMFCSARRSPRDRLGLHEVRQCRRNARGVNSPAAPRPGRAAARKHRPAPACCRRDTRTRRRPARVRARRAVTAATTSSARGAPGEPAVMQRICRRAGEAARSRERRGRRSRSPPSHSRARPRARLHRARWRWRRSCRRARRSCGAQDRKRRALSAESPARMVLDRDSARVFFARRIGEARRDDGDAFRAVRQRDTSSRADLPSASRARCGVPASSGSPSRPRRSRRRPSRPALRHGRELFLAAGARSR